MAARTLTIRWSDLPEAFSRIAEPSPWSYERVGLELDALEAVARNDAHSAGFERRELGRSVEDRRIDWVQVGRGPTRVMAWARMHGDEPTHTGVLLRAVRFLLGSPSHPIAQSVLDRCALGIVPMVNPDGAERVTRFNARGVDLNRDARDFATPEARLLRDAAIDFDPRFAFNLHNQDHRKAARTDYERVGAALLAPPRADGDTDHPSYVLACRLASVILEAIRPECPGAITRFAMDYTPTAFGEWFQSRGVATVLIESGALDRSGERPQEDLHLLALLTTLGSIADGTVEQQSPAPYEALETPADEPLFDRVLRRVAIDGSAADVAIRYPTRSAAAPEAMGGAIETIGDLKNRGALCDDVGSAGTVCLPGRIGLWRPAPNETSKNWEEALRLGFTTVLTAVRLDEGSGGSDPDADPLPLNVGLIGECETLNAAGLAAALRRSVVAVVCSKADPDIAAACETAGIPLLEPGALPEVGGGPIAASDEWCAESCESARRLGLGGRGVIDRGAAADLVLLDSTTRRLRRVYVEGSLSWDDGRLAEGRGGVVLRGSWRVD